LLTLFELIDKAARAKTQDPSLRYGQALMNVLSKSDKEMYDAITGTDFDPFHLDARLGRFYVAFLELSAARTKAADKPTDAEAL
jgi:hypothetical protein